MKKKPYKFSIWFLVGAAFITLLLGMALGSSSYSRFLTGSVITGMSVNELMEMSSENQALHENLRFSQSQIETIKGENTGLREKNIDLRNSILGIINTFFSGQENEEITKETETTDTTENTRSGGSYNTGTYHPVTPETPEEPSTPPAPPIPEHPMVPVNPITPSPPTIEEPGKIVEPLQPAP